MPERVFIITGDYSGDVHAAAVVRELRRRRPEIALAAVGGETLKAEGVDLLSDQSRMGLVGFGAVLGAPYHYFLGRKILKFLEGFKPDAVLLIDYGVFNLWMAARLKKRGYKVLYFIPPQVWATRQGRIRKIKRHVDHVFCIFPFEETMYREHGIPVTYVGHPLVGQLPPAPDRAAFCAEHGLDPDRPIIGLFPGSRKLEVDYLLADLIGGAAKISAAEPRAQFVLAKAASLNGDYFRQRLREALGRLEHPPSVTVLENQNHTLLGTADLAVVASGTVTLEAALYGTPIVLVYRLHPLVYQIAIRLYKKPCIGLPNILTDVNDPVITELWQDRVTPDEIAQAALPLLDKGSPESQKARAGFAAIQTMLKGGAPANVAQGILGQIGAEAALSGTVGT